MPDDPPDASPAPEPKDPAFQRWLGSPAGEAAMSEVMRKVVAGDFGEVPDELRALAVEGLKTRALEANLAHVQTAMQALMAAMQQDPEPSQSRWRHVHALHQQAKMVTDLILEVPEPQRTALMKLMLPLQEMLEKQERETK
jgi:hypothetical protein